mmetsp:Transcript_10694/g.29726  ORF Transcript_10694/g.29726 Transcript_10694/m.29726 type:complete len:203 (+) Transcript_10694:101-709(+)
MTRCLFATKKYSCELPEGRRDATATSYLVFGSSSPSFLVRLVDADSSCLGSGPSDLHVFPVYLNLGVLGSTLLSGVMSVSTANGAHLRPGLSFEPLTFNVVHEDLPASNAFVPLSLPAPFLLVLLTSSLFGLLGCGSHALEVGLEHLILVFLLFFAVVRQPLTLCQDIPIEIVPLSVALVLSPLCSILVFLFNPLLHVFAGL